MRTKIYTVIAENAIIENNKLIFPVFWGNSLYIYDFKKKFPRRITDLLEEKRDKYFRLCKAMAVSGRKLVVAPFFDNHFVLIVDLENGVTKRYDVDILLSVKDYAKQHIFSQCYAYDDVVYLVGMSYPGIIKIDTRTGHMSLMNEFINTDDKLHFGYGIEKENYFVLPFVKEDKILFVDGKKGTYYEQKLGSHGKGFEWLTCGCDDEIWLLDNFGKRLVRYHSKNKNYELFPLPERPEKEISFENLMWVDGKIFLFPVQADHVYCFDPIGGYFYVNEKLKEITNCGLDDGVRKKRILNFPFKKNHIFMVEINDGRWNEIHLPECTIRSFYMPEAIENIKDGSRNMIKESGNIGLSDFLGMVCDMEDIDNG